MVCHNCHPSVKFGGKSLARYAARQNGLSQLSPICQIFNFWNMTVLKCLWNASIYWKVSIGSRNGLRQVGFKTFLGLMLSYDLDDFDLQLIYLICYILVIPPELIRELVTKFSDAHSTRGSTVAYQLTHAWNCPQKTCHLRQARTNRRSLWSHQKIYFLFS